MRFSHLLASLLLFVFAAVAQPGAQVSSGRGKLSPEESGRGWSSLPPGARESILAALRKDDAGWPQEGELTPSDGNANDAFGYSVAIDGTTTVVGAIDHTVGSNQYQGVAYVFVESGGVWSQQAELIASDGEPLDQFGDSVAISGSTIVVGATKYYNGGPGVAYVFENSGGTWKQQAELTSPQSGGAANDQFGISVAIDGSMILVGAPFRTVNSKQYQGTAYVFVQNGNKWTRDAELTASDGRAGDHFGVQVALSGITAAVGAPCHPSQDYLCESPGPGAAYVYVDNGGVWSQQAELTPSDGLAWDEFGAAVAVNGSTAVVGAPCHPAPIGWPCYHSPGPGAAYVFVGNGGTWSQQAELTLPNPQALEDFGWAVAINGGTTVIGALEHTVDSNQFQGAAFVFVQSGKDWVQGAELTASDGEAWDQFGNSVSMDGSAIVVAASCHPASYPNCGPGAAYVFVPEAPSITFSPPSLSFGNEPVNNTSKAKTVTVKNTGTSTLTFTNIAASANYAVSSTTCDATLDGGKTCKVNVTFTPTQLGPATGALAFTDNAPNSPQTVALSGTGVADATLAPASARFPKTKVGTTSAAKTFTLTNSQPVALTSIAISTKGDFAVSATTCRTSLGAKAKCTIGVTFTPQAIGMTTGQLVVSDNASGSPQTANLSGTGN
jgi:hypothetical protein